MENGEYTLLNAQLAFFFKERQERPDLLYQPLNEAVGEIFQNTPIVVPVPNEPNLDTVPIVQLSAGKHRINIARTRMDFFLTGTGMQTFEDVRTDFVKKVDALKGVLETKDVAVKRVGFVRRYFISDTNAGDRIGTLLVALLHNYPHPSTKNTPRRGVFCNTV